MNTAIQKILNELSEAISVELAAANERATKAELEKVQLCDDLRVILQGSPKSLGLNTKRAAAVRPTPANDLGTPNNIRATETKKRAPSLSDQTFLDALNYEWTTASKLWRGLNLCGIPVGEGTVYNRMRKLAADFPDEVEATNMPERWRRKVGNRHSHDDNGFNVKVAGKRKRPLAEPRLRLVSTERSTAHSGKGGGQ